MVGKVSGVQPGLPAVCGVGYGEEAGDVGVALPGPGQENKAGVVGESQLSTGDGPDTQAVGQPCELQGPAQVGVGEGQGGVAVLYRLGQQLVDVGCPCTPKE